MERKIPQQATKKVLTKRRYLIALGFLIGGVIVISFAIFVIGSKESIFFVITPLGVVVALGGRDIFFLRQVRIDNMVVRLIAIYVIYWVLWLTGQLRGFVGLFPDLIGLGSLFGVFGFLGYFYYIWRHGVPTGLQSLSRVFQVREIKDIIVSFFLFYLGLIFLFGMAYASIRKFMGPHTFMPHEGLSLWDFFYYSAVTITTLGYGDIRPISGIARLLSVIEVLIGIALLAIYVGVTISVLNSRRRN